MRNRPGTIFLVALLAGLSLRLLIGFRDLRVIDRLFIPDDAYYTLSIARSLALGQGPTVDGQILTNGFQPLLAFLIAPIFWLTPDPDLRLSLLLTAMTDATSIMLLGFLCFRLAGPLAGGAAALLWAVSPIAVANSLNGLETSLSVFLVLLAVTLWHAEITAPCRWKRLLLGVAWGLALLARIDTALAIAFFTLVGLIHRRWRLLLTTGLAAIVTVAPWWLYQILRFGTVVPESGAAVKAITALYQELYLTVPGQLAWGLGTILGNPVIMFPGLIIGLFDQPVLTCLTFVCFAFLVGVAAGKILRKAGENAAVFPAATIMAWGAGIFFFYTFYLPALWFFPRYLLPTSAALTIVLAGSLGRIWNIWPSSRSHLLILLGIALLILVSSRQSLSFCWTTPMGTLDQWMARAYGYRQAAEEVLRLLPKGAVVGSLQSGALAYYGFNRIKIVNLGGVVDQQAAVAFRTGQLGRYARSRALTHVVDWPLNIDNLKRRGGQEMQTARLVERGRASLQWNKAMTVYEVHWPESPQEKPQAPPK